MYSRLLSTLLACVLVFFTIAGAGGFVAISTQPPKLQITDRPLDLAIQGEGYFRVQLPISSGGGVGYTRNGHFFIDAQGRLTLGSDNALLLDPPLALPAGANDINVANDGVVTAFFKDPAARQEVGRIFLVCLTNGGGLVRDARFKDVDRLSTVADYSARMSPSQHRPGKILQGYLEVPQDQ